MRRRLIISLIFGTVVYSLLLVGCGGSGASSSTASSPQPIPPVANACQRPTAGSLVTNPPDLFSHNGLLKVNFSYQTATDGDGRTLFCFMTP
jgi:hypothetical protein